MANRYWVGGTASWDGTAGTKWALTSGGAGGQAVPTAADDVFFDGNSGASTVTIATGNTGAKSITCTGFTGTLTGSGSITVSGSVTLVAGMTYTHAGTVTFNGTGTLTTAGKTFSNITVNGAGITLTLGDALSISARTLTVTAGTFTTANFNVTAGILSSSGTSTRTITLGSSTLDLSSGGTPINFATSTNLTFNANTSQINLSGLSPLFSGGGQTFNNVSFTATSLVTASTSVDGANTFNNLTLTGPGVGNAGHTSFTFSANQTITGTLTCAGATALRRCFIASSILGAARTLTVGTLSANDCDFRDITLAGAASGASPTRAGDCGGNTNITFPAAKTVYRVGTSTTWGGSSSWATSSGGAGADTNFPLAQDTAIINNDTTLTGTLSVGTYNYGAVDASTRTTGITLSHGAAVTRYGSYAFGSGVTVSGTSAQTFSGRGTMDFTSAGKTITFPITVDAPGGTFRLLDALTMNSTIALSHTNGTINLNGLTLTVGTSYTTTSGTKNLTFNGGTLVCPAASPTAFNNAAPALFTTTAGTGTGTINMTAATAKTFVGGGRTYNCTLNNGGAGALTITGSNTFTTIANSVQPTTFTFTAGTTTTLTNWNVSGTAGNLVTIQSATAASHTLSKASGAVSADYLSISRSTATGGATWYAGANSTDGGNNSGWVFAALITATMAASEVGPDVLAATAFIGYNVSAAMAASEVGPDIFAGSADITAGPSPVAGGVFFIELRSFTERRRF